MLCTRGSREICDGCLPVGQAGWEWVRGEEMK